MTLPIHSALINSPLWYTSSILDTFEWNHEEKSGIFYYGSRNLIYFIKIYEIDNKSKFVDYKICKNNYETKIQYYIKAHHEYIVGLCTIPNGILMSFKDFKLLPRFASCGKDKMIRIWSFNEDSGCCSLKEFNLSSTKIMTNPTCISINSSNTILCGFEKGYLLSWNYLVEGESKVFYTINEYVVQICWNESKFAVAYKNGVVIIYKYTSYDSISKLTQFRAHSSELCNISWNPIAANFNVWGDLATSGKDRKVKLWKTETNFNLRTLSLPNSLKKSEQSAASNWCSIRWSAANNGSLIVTTGFGNIAEWKWPSTANADLKYFSQNNLTKPHSKSIFGLAEFPNHCGLIVSHSLDRLLNVSFISTSDEAGGEHVYSLPCLGGSVLSLHAVAHSNQLAIGCGDNHIRLWRFDNNQLQNQHQTRHEVSAIWNDINGKVMSLCWHPTKEGLLVFGTDGGDVGYVNTSKEKKVAVTSRLHHNGKVFVSTWAADIRADDRDVSDGHSDDDAVMAYTVGKDALFLHDFRGNDFVDVTHLVCDDGRCQRVSDFASHPSLRYIAVGYASGVVRVFSKNRRRDCLTVVCQLTSHCKGINCIRWGPPSATNDARYRLAVASNERFITVTDLSAAIDAFEANVVSTDWRIVTFDDPLALLKGHGDRVTSIDWSPFDPDRLVSASYDHSALVWLVSTQSAVATFGGHQGKLMCCQWSRRDADLIYTGGEDGNLFVWRPSEQATVDGVAVMHRRKHNVDTVPEIGGSHTAMTEDRKKGDMGKKVELHIHSRKDTSSKQETLKKRPSLFPTTLFKVHHPMEAYQNALLQILDNTDINCPLKWECDLPCLNLLGPRSAILRELDRELVHHHSEGNLDNYFLLLLWACKLPRVNDDVISMDYCPYWLMAAIVGYAASDIPDSVVALVAPGDVLLRATFWLSLFKTRKAIDLLVQHGYLREALVLARLRWKHNHEVFHGTLLPLLRDSLYKNGSFEMAAMCSVQLGQYRDAVETMGRRSTRLASWVAIKLLLVARGQENELLHQCVLNFVHGILLGVLEPDSVQAVDNRQWIARIEQTREVAVYSMVIDLHRYLWVEGKTAEEMWELLKERSAAAARDDELGWSMMCSEIRGKLVTQQTNQSQSQIAIYITYVVWSLFICDLVDGALLLPQLSSLISQMNDVNGSGQHLIDLLIGPLQTHHGQSVAALIVDLSSINLT